MYHRVKINLNNLFNIYFFKTFTRYRASHNSDKANSDKANSDRANSDRANSKEYI